MREEQLAKIVIIEDDLTFLDLLRVHLASAGHEVLTAEDAVLGLRAVIDNAPDLILLDLSVPYLDGFEILEAQIGSTRLNSSHLVISYAVFCLKKKKKTWHTNRA